MKYRLETIPVWRAYERETDCPLCLLRDQAEARLIRSFLGGLVMSPAVRTEVNDAGFCPRHYRMLFEQQEGKLGLALMSHTHLASRLERTRTINRRLWRTRLLRGAGKARIQELTAKLAAERDRCVICPRLLETLRRYAFTIVHEWEGDERFRKVLGNSRGFCMEHYALVMDVAAEVLSPASFASWVAFTGALQEQVMEEVGQELLAFTQRFDYRKSAGKWENERRVVGRAVDLLAGSSGGRPFTLHERLLEGKRASRKLQAGREQEESGDSATQRESRKSRDSTARGSTGTSAEDRRQRGS